MNKVIYLLLTAALMSNAVCAQKLAADKIPPAVSTAFKAKFPTATKTSWEMENENEYEAGFRMNGEEVSATYDNTGKWLETETEIKVSALPVAVHATLSKDFAGFKIIEAVKVESVQNRNGFEAEVEKGEESFDVLFSADGIVLSKTKLEKEEDEKD